MTSATSEFGLFPFLPTEIRVQIWHHTFVPRTIDISMLSLYYLPCPAPPIALRINHESRTLALFTYHKLVTSHDSRKPWVSTSLDTARISSNAWQNSDCLRLFEKWNPWLCRGFRRLDVQSDDLAEANKHMNYRIKFCDRGERRWMENDLFPMFEGLNEVAFSFRLVLDDEEAANAGEETTAEYAALLQKTWLWYGELRKYEPWLNFRPPEVLKAIAREGRVLAEMRHGQLVTGIPKKQGIVPRR